MYSTVQYTIFNILSVERVVALSMVSPSDVNASSTTVLGSIPASSDAVGDVRFVT